MSSSKYEGKFREEKKDPLAAFLPIIGLLIFAIAAAVGYFAAPFALELTSEYIPPNVINSLNDIDPNAPIYTMAFLIFLVIIMFFSTIYAVFAPKPDKMVSEATLKRERDAKDLERRRIKQRKRKMRERMRQANQDLDEM